MALAVLIGRLVSGQPHWPKRELERQPGPKGPTVGDDQCWGTVALSGYPPPPRSGVVAAPSRFPPHPVPWPQPLFHLYIRNPLSHSHQKGATRSRTSAQGVRVAQPGPASRGVRSTCRVDGVKSLCEVSAQCCCQPPS